jgi:hypothetical protein
MTIVRVLSILIVVRVADNTVLVLAVFFQEITGFAKMSVECPTLTS